MLPGKGVYARKSFKKGDLVTVSPVLLMDKDTVAKIALNSHSIIQNYCLASSLSSVALLPFGWGALVNHASPKKANMELEWYWWNEKDEYHQKEKERKISSTLLELSKAHVAQLDIGYIATRDITEGEELFIYYGETWFGEWSTYLARVSEWSIEKLRRTEIREIRNAMKEFQKTYTAEEAHEIIEYTDDLSEVPMPRFHSFIGAPDNLFFPLWRDLENPPIQMKEEKGGNTVENMTSEGIEVIESSEGGEGGEVKGGRVLSAVNAVNVESDLVVSEEEGVGEEERSAEVEVDSNGDVIENREVSVNFFSSNLTNKEKGDPLIESIARMDVDIISL